MVPAINQVELHPYFTNATVQVADKTLGILTQAWSAIGGINRYRPAGAGDVLGNPVITGLATKYGKTPARVVLRWHLDEGRSALPKSITPSRIAENLDVFDFTLQPDSRSRSRGRVDARWRASDRAQGRSHGSNAWICGSAASAAASPGAM